MHQPKDKHRLFGVSEVRDLMNFHSVLNGKAESIDPNLIYESKDEIEAMWMESVGVKL